jgi:hypothetical protein
MQTSETRIDQYHEIEEEPKILEFLRRRQFIGPVTPATVSMAGCVTSKLLQPYATLETTRTKYHLQNVTIDLDETDFGYSIGELEVMAQATSQDIARAEASIRAFAREHQLITPPNIQGKVLTYIYQHNKPHYEALRKSGLLKSKGIEP